jgi:hypothetical protein
VARAIRQTAASRSGHGGVDGVEELDAQVLSMVLVPSTGGAIFRVGFFFETNVRIHRRL